MSESKVVSTIFSKVPQAALDKFALKTIKCKWGREKLRKFLEQHNLIKINCREDSVFITLSQETSSCGSNLGIPWCMF